MDMFNKLKSAVSSALPGNPLSKDFEVYGQIGTAGPGLLWKIYSGMKRTTKQVHILTSKLHNFLNEHVI
jgi:SCY1-like protein 2